MRFQCPNCKKILEAESDAAGTDVSCPDCKEHVRVPESLCSPGVIYGDFMIQEELARGGMGIVCKAVQLNLDRFAALKILSPAHSGDPLFLELFLREAKLAAQLNHPGIVQAYAAGTESGICYFAMEFIDGRTTKSILDEERVLPVQQAFDIIEKVAEALDYAWTHGNVIHRDIKPENIMISRKGDVKLTDLGLARTSNMTADPGSIFGTPQYISPECLKGEKTDSRSDIYSLGAVFYQFITGRFPFPGKTAEEIMEHHLHDEMIRPDLINPQIPSQIGDIIVRMMAKDPGDRYQNAAELLEDMHQFINGHAPKTFDRQVTLTSERVRTVTVKLPVRRRARTDTGIRLTGAFRTAKPGTPIRTEDSSLRMEKMKKRREIRARMTVSLIIAGFLVSVIAIILLIRWMIYVPQMNLREAERRMSEMRQQANRNAAGINWVKLPPGHPAQLRAELVRLCMNNDYVQALRYIYTFSIKYGIPQEIMANLRDGVMRARDFHLLLMNSGVTLAGVKFVMDDGRTFRVIKVRMNMMDAEDLQDNDLVSVPLVTLSYTEYERYALAAAQHEGVYHNFVAYLVFNGYFEMADRYAQTDMEHRAIALIARAYIRQSLIGAAPAAFKNIKRQYGTLPWFKDAVSGNKLKEY